jgi:nucleoside 2-deoxyribosyltransferase
MSKRFIYLSGKIIAGHAATNYRGLVAKRLLELGFHSLDPLRGKYKIEEWQSLSPNEILVRDLSDIDRSSVMLAVMMQSRRSSFGTPCEIFYAWQKHIPTILVTDEQYLVNHPWIKTLCSHVFVVNNLVEERSFMFVLEEAVEHIGKWYGEKTENEVYSNPSLLETPQSVSITPIAEFEITTCSQTCEKCTCLPTDKCKKCN